MHNYKLRIQSLVLAVALLLLSLSSCKKPGGAEGTQPPEPSKIAASTDPTHFYEEVRDGLLIDAEVIGPPEGLVPRIYVGQCKTFSKEEISVFLEHIGDKIREIDTDEIVDKNYCYGGTCDSGSTFFQRSSMDSSVPSCTFGYMNYESFKRYLDYPIYLNQEDYDRNGGMRLAYLFEEPIDFSFATAQEAESAIRTALEKLGLSNMILNRTLYINHEAMLKASEVLQSDEWTNAGKGGEEVLLKEDDWSIDDDCYMFEFFASVDGVPMIYHSWKSETLSYCGNEIQVWYNSEGIIFLEADYVWVTDEAVQTPEQILSATEAIAIARDKLSNVILKQDNILNRVSFRYFYIQDGDRWLLKPVWEISTQHESEWNPGSYEYEYILVDAVTGKEI